MLCRFSCPSSCIQNSSPHHPQQVNSPPPGVLSTHLATKPFTLCYCHQILMRLPESHITVSCRLLGQKWVVVFHLLRALWCNSSYSSPHCASPDPWIDNWGHWKQAPCTAMWSFHGNTQNIDILQPGWLPKIWLKTGTVSGGTLWLIRFGLSVREKNGITRDAVFDSTRKDIS